MWRDAEAFARYLGEGEDDDPPSPEPDEDAAAEPAARTADEPEIEVPF